MNTGSQTHILDVVATSLELPASAYESAAERYRDLGNWLSDVSNASSAYHAPGVSAQGSFRLGTGIKPLQREDYDLDLALTLREGIEQDSWSQEQLKLMVGSDLERYRSARGIEERVEEKHRCWRLNYRDHLSFHLDVVPGIPQPEPFRASLMERMVGAGTAEQLASDVAALAVAITDDRHRTYRVVAPDWLVSNPEGYARWFESRMRQAGQFLKARLRAEGYEDIDDLPVYRWKTPLQQCVQMLKRHRDLMFRRAPGRKPISIIITTLAARAYNGEADLRTAIATVLEAMPALVNDAGPRIPNPVNPQEDFADRWATADGRRQNLEQSFWQWVEQVRADFQLLMTAGDRDFLEQQVLQKFGLRLEGTAPGARPSVPTENPYPRRHRIVNPPKPWRR